MSIEGQGHFLTLAQGRVHSKIQNGFSQKLLCRSETNFYAPNFEKVGSILVSACPCVRPCVCVRPSVQKKIQARVLKFHIWIPRQKIAYPYFFSCLNYLPLPSYVVVLGFYVPPTAKVIRRRDLGLKSHPKDWRSPGSNSRPLVYKAGGLTFTPRRLLLAELCPF